MKELEKKVAELQEQLATAEAKNSADQAVISELNKKVSEQDAIIAELNQKVAEQDKAVKAEFPVVKIEKQSYQVVIPKFIFNGTEYKAADVKKDADLAKALLEEKSAVLQPIK